MEVDGKLRIASHARMWYIYLHEPYTHNPGVHGRFYGLDLKMTADSKFKGKNTGYTRNLHGQWLSGKGCWSYFVTKLA